MRRLKKKQLCCCGFDIRNPFLFLDTHPLKMRLDATAHEDLSKYYPDEMEHNSDLWYFSDQQFTKSYSSEIDFDNLFFCRQFDMICKR